MLNQGCQKIQHFLQCYSQKKLQRIKKHGLIIQQILLTGKQEIISRTLPLRVFGECNVCFPAFPQRKTHEGDVKKAPQSIVTLSIPAGVPSNRQLRIKECENPKQARPSIWVNVRQHYNGLIRELKRIQHN